MSAASPERQQGWELLPGHAKQVAADRNVRAPLSTRSQAPGLGGGLNQDY